MKHIIVHRDPNSYVHNPDVVRSPTGEMVMTFRQAPRRARCTHIDPLSTAPIIRSTDNGQTWTPPERRIIAATGAGATTSPGGTGKDVGIQDPSITLLRDGKMICSFFTWYAPADAPYGAVVPGTFATISPDGGKTWNPRHINIAPSAYVGADSATSDAIVEMPNGDLLIPMYDGNAMPQGGGYRAVTFRSTDRGQTWHEWGVMGLDPFGSLDFCEPALAVLPSGKLVAMIREEKKKECLWQSDSTDGGKTWTTPRRTPMWGFPADLLPLKSGKLLCTYGYRRRPYGVRAVLSHDEGRTWDYDNELVLRKDGIGPDVGYPSSVQLDDGTIFTAYYLTEPSTGPAVGAGATNSTGSAAGNPDDPATHFSDGGLRYIAASFYREW